MSKPSTNNYGTAEPSGNNSFSKKQVVPSDNSASHSQLELSHIQANTPIEQPIPQAPDKMLVTDTNAQENEILYDEDENKVSSS